jgi:hyaluronan synthase
MTNFIMRSTEPVTRTTQSDLRLFPHNSSVFKTTDALEAFLAGESLIAAKFIWKKERSCRCSLYGSACADCRADCGAAQPGVCSLTQHIFPGAFLMGILLMALLMSVADLFFRKSSIWIFGLVFCVFMSLFCFGRCRLRGLPSGNRRGAPV